jgi:hypothetical protein
MATYQDQPAFQTYQVNPYQAPAQEMVQAIATRNSYWDSAASSVRNAYQNYLNLDLTRQDNHQRLNELMTGVNEQLKQVTQTDLSLGENYGRALSVFDPIIKDDNIMGDNAITKHYKDQYSIAQGYRIKDNGKGYSDTNVRDLSNHLQDFATDANASNWRQHYSTRSFYTPYYDTAAEIRQIGKEFKPDVKSLTSPLYLDANGKPTDKGGSPSGYLLNQTDKSIIASQYRAFVDSHLSDKAKDQLAIDGRVKYHDNIGALANDYTASNQEKINHYNTEIKSLNGAIAGATDDQKDAIRSQINNYTALVKELSLENTKMKAGDYSNVLPYRNQIASKIYTDNYMDYLSKASAQHNVDIKYTPDQVWKTMYQEDNENKRFNIARQTQMDIANLNADTRLEIAGLKMYGKSVPGFGGIPVYGMADKTNDESFGRDKYNTLRTDSSKEFSDAVDQMNRKIAADKGIDPNDTKIPAETRNSAVTSWMNDPRNKNDVDQYYKAAQKRSSEQQLFSGIDDYVDKTLQTKYPEIYNYRKSVIDNVKLGQNIVLTPRQGGQSINVNLSPDDIKSIIQGKGNLKLGSYEEYNSMFTAPGSGGAPTANKVQTLTYNGKEYRFNYGTLAESLNKLDEGTNKFNETRDNLLSQNITRIAGKERIFQNDKNLYYNAAHNLTTREILGSTYVIKPDDVVLTAKDRQGDLYFKVQGDTKVNISAIKDRVAAAGGRYIKGDDEFVLPGRLFGSITGGQSFSDPKLSAIQSLVDFRSSATPNDRLTTTPQTWGNRNFSFKVDIQNGHPSYKIVDPYSGAQFGADSNGTPFSTLESAAAQATNLGNLNPDQYINFIKTVGGVPGYQPK